MCVCMLHVVCTCVCVYVHICVCMHVHVCVCMKLTITWDACDNHMYLFQAHVYYEGQEVWDAMLNQVKCV